MRMLTEEVIVLEMNEKDYECKDGKTRHFYNVKVGSEQYENITYSVKEDVYKALDLKDRVVFKGHYGGLKSQFWGIDEIVRLNGKEYKA